MILRSDRHNYLRLTESNINPFLFLHSSRRNLTSLLRRCLDAKTVHARIMRTLPSGRGGLLFAIGKVIGVCAVSEHGDMEYAARVFGRIDSPDGFLWNTMIRGFSRTGDHPRAFEYYRGMQEQGICADNFTFCFLLKVSLRAGSLRLGKQLHCAVVKLGYEKHVFVASALIHVHGMLGDVDAACDLFDEMRGSESVVLWNTMIDCLVYCGKHEKALDMFRHMLRSGIEPDEATMVVVLSACSRSGALDYGRWLHGLLGNSPGLSEAVSVRNALVDMYSKCGAVEEASAIFEEMEGTRNLVTWNSMILGFASHGRVHEALGLSSRLLRNERLRPDDVTFLGILCACSHSGLVEDGRRWFQTMKRDYSIEPSIMHYGCMVDMLGRAGYLAEAYQMILGMPIERNAVVWRSLLGACRTHGNIKLGEVVRQRLEEIEPDHSSDYVLLSSIRASASQWNEVLDVRRSMRCMGVTKPKPGRSSVA